MLNEYEISYTDYDQTNAAGQPGVRVVVGTAKAPNGISAIKYLLTRKFQGQPELVDAVVAARAPGSNKYLRVAGVPFEAKKLS